MNTLKIMQKAVEDYKNIESKRYLGIFGNPIKHTLSPIIHDTISDELSLEERYIPFEIQDDLGRYVKEAFEDGIVGLNITVPYKEKVIPYLSDIDEDAKKIGAVNTLVRCENGYKGYNTDMEGLYKSIIEAGMNIFSERGIAQFMDGIKSGKSKELMHITEGYHYHTVRADSEATLDKIEAALDEKAYIVPEIM